LPGVVTGREKSRRPSIRGKAAAQVEKFHDARPPAGETQSNTKPPRLANDDGKPKRSAIVTVRDRKTVQRQREQQQVDAGRPFRN
jgi:hypothetical protein